MTDCSCPLHLSSDANLAPLQATTITTSIAALRSHQPIAKTRVTTRTHSRTYIQPSTRGSPFTTSFNATRGSNMRLETTQTLEAPRQELKTQLEKGANAAEIRERSPINDALVSNGPRQRPPRRHIFEKSPILHPRNGQQGDERGFGRKFNEGFRSGTVAGIGRVRARRLRRLGREGGKDGWIQKSGRKEGRKGGLVRVLDEGLGFEIGKNGKKKKKEGREGKGRDGRAGESEREGGISPRSNGPRQRPPRRHIFEKSPILHPRNGQQGDERGFGRKFDEGFRSGTVAGIGRVRARDLPRRARRLRRLGREGGEDGWIQKSGRKEGRKGGLVRVLDEGLGFEIGKNGKTKKRREGKGRDGRAGESEREGGISPRSLVGSNSKRLRSNINTGVQEAEHG